jgi:hypothetical protein
MTFYHVSNSHSFVTLMISKYFFLLPATATLQMRRLNLMFRCIDSGMQLNLGKCKSISFTKSTSFTRHFRYELSDHRLDSVNSICDLGVVLDSMLNCTSHIDSLIVKASRMLGYIRRIGKKFSDPYTFKTLYNSFVRSHLDYASVVWNPYYGVHLKRIEAIQKKFLRFALRTSEV